MCIELPFGELLRRYRLAASLTQEVLAERAGLSARAISDLERGVKQHPHQETVGRLITALELTGDERAALARAGRPWPSGNAQVAAGVSGSEPQSPRQPRSGRSGGTGPPVDVRPASACARARVPEDEADAASAHARAPVVEALRHPEGTREHPGPPLVGRAAELTLLERHLAGEGPPVLLLAGEPGIGKTRLLQEAVSRAMPLGWTVLRGGCTRSGGQEPFAPILEALESCVRDWAPAALQVALRSCAWLVLLLPELADTPIEPLPAWRVTLEQERRLMFKAVAQFLTNVSGPAGTLLVLDDLQWAGSDALDLLAMLLRSPGTPLRVVGAYRDTELQPDGPLAVALADLAARGTARRYLLEPLTAEAVSQLVAALREGTGGDAAALAEQVARRTGGVPFYVVSCALAPDRPAAECDDGVPWNVQQSIRQRAAVLPPLAQEVLSAASAIGRSVPADLLTAVVEQPEAVVLRALDTLARARLLVEEDAGYQFAHDLIREVVEAGIGRARRLALHRRIGEALEWQAGSHGAGLPVAALAYHYGRGDAQDKALLYLEQAGDSAAEQAAHSTAADYYRQAAARLDEMGRPVEAARMREKLGAALLTVGHPAQAIEALELSAEALHLAGEVEALGSVVARIGQAHARLGTLEQGVARVRPQLELLAVRGHSRSLARLWAALADLYMNQGQPSTALAAATNAAEIARTRGDRDLLATATHLRGQALTLTGHDEEAIRALQEADAEAEAGSYRTGDARSAGTLAWIAEDRGEFDRCRWYASRMLAAGERLSDPYVVRQALYKLTALAFFTGEWAEAHAHIERIRELPERSPSSDAAAALERGRLLLAQGDWEQAPGYLEEASVTDRRAGSLAVHRTAESLLAEWDLLAGRPHAAVARLLPLLDRDSQEERVVTTYVLPTLAWTYLEVGQTDEAARVIAEAGRRARARTYRLTLVTTLRMQALVALRQGAVQTAVDALEEGLQLARALPYPHGEGRLLEVYGRLLLEHGETATARERLEAALAVFLRLGARKDAVRAEQLLTKLG